MKAASLSPMAHQIALGPSLARHHLANRSSGLVCKCQGRSNSHRSEISPLFFRVNSSSGDALFLIIDLSQAAIFSAESSLSEHLSLCCSTAKTGRLTKMAADKMRARTVFIIVIFL